MNGVCLNALACGMLACFLFAASGCRQTSAGAVAPAPIAMPIARLDATPDAALKDLQNLDELRALFNKDKDAPRLILLLSPT